MAAVAYTKGCKSSDFSGQLSQLRKTAVRFHFALRCAGFFLVFVLFSKGEMDEGELRRQAVSICT